MELYSLALIARWIIPLWLLGWLMLPVSRQIFPNLPDGGLAAGRLLALVVVSLAAFWTASLNLVSLSYSCWGIVIVPCLLCSSYLYSRKRRGEFFLWVTQTKKALWISDLVFLLGFLVFVYLRLCQPEIHDQEKPMDSAIIGVLSRTFYLPADNPWFSGVPFTNYYYFGHFMAAILKRVFSTPLPYAYNLIQPVFCAFFLSTLWSLCAAVTGSLRAGLLATALIALCGNYEPLRQLFNAWQNHSSLWPLDWWSTSRVIANTINEYPFFTLALGDAHAHFFALSLGALLLCLFYILTMETPPNVYIGNLNVVLSAVILGAVVITNPWDAPLYFFLGVMALILYGRNQRKLHNGSMKFFVPGLFVLWLSLPLIVASPFLWHFNSPSRGFDFELWFPGLTFFLHWGSFLSAALFVLIRDLKREGCHSRTSRFCCLLLIAGTIAVLLPCVIYIKGHFSEDFRHQDTVFKFWLQGWILAGVPIFCGIARRFVDLPVFTKSSELKGMVKIPANALSEKLLLVCGCLIPVLCSLIVFQARTRPTANPLTLNGARFLPASDQHLVEWLEKTALPGTIIVEAVGENPDGSLIGAYTEFGRISFLTGLPSYLSWPQHVMFWGVSREDVVQRHQFIRELYSRHNRTNTLLRKDAQSLSGTADVHGDERHGFPLLSSQPLVIWAGLEHSIYGAPSEAVFNRAVFQHGTLSENQSLESPTSAIVVPLFAIK